MHGIMKNSQRRKRAVALVLLLCLILPVLFSELFIFSHISHEHNSAEGNCIVCIKIQTSENLLRQICIAVTKIPLDIMALFTVAVALYALTSSQISSTPINCKIRMND